MGVQKGGISVCSGVPGTIWMLSASVAQPTNTSTARDRLNILCYCCAYLCCDSNTLQAADGSVIMSGLSSRGSSRPKNTLPLLTSTVKMDADDPAMRCCFRWAPGAWGWEGGRVGF
jgi:hypothetical protein